MQRHAVLRRFKADAVVVSEGEPLPFVGVVVSGVLRLTQMLSDGRQQIVGLLLPESLVGRPFAETSRYSVETATDVVLYTLDRTHFEDAITTNPWLERLFFRMTLDALDAARSWTALIGSQRIKERIAAFLFLCGSPALRYGHPGLAKVVVPIDRQDMAALLGTTPETISRFVRDLMRQGILRIKSSREFEILDRRAFLALAGQSASVPTMPVPAGLPLAAVSALPPVPARLPLQPARPDRRPVDGSVLRKAAVMAELAT